MNMVVEQSIRMMKLAVFEFVANLLEGEEGAEAGNRGACASSSETAIAHFLTFPY